MTQEISIGHRAQTGVGIIERLALEFGDNQALQSWLSIFDLKSKATARNYRTQTNKFRLFLRLLHPDWLENTHIKNATEQDVAMYELALLLKPMPNGFQPDLTISAERLEQMGLDPDTQPFGAALKKSSVNQALSVLNAMYEFLRTPNGMMIEPYVTVNPVKRVRKSATRAIQQTDRHVQMEIIQAMSSYLLSAIDRAKQEGETLAVLRYERKLWIFTLLFGLWGRREEICKLVTGDFRRQYDDTWKVFLQRKGGKEEEIPVADWVIQGMRRYRQSLGLSMTFMAGDNSPAIQGLRLSKSKTCKHIGPQALYMEIKDLAGEIASEIESGDLMPDHSDEHRALLCEQMKLFSPHWFRHTGPTIAINSGLMSLENASKMLGHSSVSITSKMYYHADDTNTRKGLDEMGAQLNVTKNSKS